MIFRVISHYKRSPTLKNFLRAMSTTKIKVQQGTVRGCEEKLPDGRSYLRFSGIPYAKPPIRQLRFLPPQPLYEFDENELDCTKERDGCIHKSTITKKYVGSEDCLNLNVYVPANTNSNKKLTVMVYLHGGGFKYDSATKDLFSPEYLLMEDVIVVTINSRQHVLGYLTLPSKGISGNAGLKDQQMALQWIHENISSFNGDADNICLFGESGGAGCVHFHVMNPKSRRFIASAICQSGTSVNDWAFYNQDEDTAVRLAKLLGSQSDSMDDVHHALMTASARDLYDNCDAVISLKDSQSGVRNIWRMVVERESEDAFITKSSIESNVSQAGEINLPMIYGTTNGDGMPPTASIISRKKLGLINDNFNLMIPRSLPERYGPEAKKLGEEIRQFYLGGRALNEETLDETIQGLMNLRTDIDYLLAQTITNELNIRYQPGSKQYLYEFQFDGKLNLQKKQMKLEHLPVAGHGDDVFYLFGGVLSDEVKLTEDSREWKMRKLMCKLWTNFAKYHDPTPDHDNPLNFKWTPVLPLEKQSKKIELDYLVINDDLEMVRNLNKERMDFWRKVYRKWHREFAKAKL